jgi:hypothetical protein
MIPLTFPYCIHFSSFWKKMNLDSFLVVYLEHHVFKYHIIFFPYKNDLMLYFDTQNLMDPLGLENISFDTQIDLGYKVKIH